MAASDHVNPIQLQLFLDPEEHIATVNRSVDSMAGAGSKTKLWEFKESQARAPARSRLFVHGAGLYNSLRRGGQIREPVRVNISTRPEDAADPLEQGQGHHRLAAAAGVQREDKARARAEGRPEVQTQFVPVEYAESRYVSRMGNTARARSGDNR